MSFFPPTNVVFVPLASMQAATPTGPTYFIQFGTPVDFHGDAAADWIVTPGVPGVSRGQLASSGRVGMAWWANVNLQQGPSAGAPRAFFSAFYDAVGVRGYGQSFEGNNWRDEMTLFYGGLQPGVALSFQVGWNGNTPLTLNPDSGLMLFSN